jgi:hypothetical protein
MAMLCVWAGTGDQCKKYYQKEHLPAPVMLAPLKEVFPVTNAPSKLAFVKFV